MDVSGANVARLLLALYRQVSRFSPTAGQITLATGAAPRRKAKPSTPSPLHSNSFGLASGLYAIYRYLVVLFSGVMMESHTTLLCRNFLKGVLILGIPSPMAGWLFSVVVFLSR